ncbi:MAG: hypothetical protein KGM16_16440 [Bacteroidota bacterium]|nr:hypothetical protein [Bacteroidota bacterium]
MNNFYIYKFNYTKKEEGNDKIISVSVIFCDRETINEDNLKDEIRKFYEMNYQTDEIYVIGSQLQKGLLKEVFIDNQGKTFIGIPKKQETHLSESLYILTFNKLGELSCCNEKKIPKEFLKNFLNEGLQNIFITRGGLVTSEGSHHFVFPSGKHCDKFLRTGNVLLISSEIYFVAFALLKHFDETKHNQIYCDTSSINSVAFALSELKNRFIPIAERKQIPIESFSSYDGLYKNELSYTKNAFLIISASTSSNIIAYILNSHKILSRENITVLYYLGDANNYVQIKDKTICNLTYKLKTNPNGIPFIKTFKGDDCEYCKRGSYAVEVKGDVFLLEKPKINPIVLSIKDPEKYLSGLLEQFKSVERKQNIFKVNYKENSNFKYEIYINFYEILEGIKNGRYDKFNQKLNDYINQFVPSNLKYLITLNDVASSDLANYIIDKIKQNYKKAKLPKKITQDELSEIKMNSEGTALVVGSCIANGKNLLFISRALRKFDKLRIVYFVGISRTKNREYLAFLKSNLKQGKHGSESSSFIDVESIYCNNDSKNTSWLSEIKFLKKLIEFVSDEDSSSAHLQYLKERKKMLESSQGDRDKGLANKLFYPRFSNSKIEELSIRKNFAFFNFDHYDTDVSQADIYFTISNIINTLRNSNPNGNSEKSERTLKQSVYVRNILDPANFSRFNDGIIQSSILRAAYPEELSYGIDNDISQEMTNTLETIIKYCVDEQGEALLEFLYAIANKKMTLKKIHLQKIVDLLTERIETDLIKWFTKYIDKKVLNEEEITLKKLFPRTP